MTKKDVLLVHRVWDYYNKNGRHTLPWRVDTSFYSVLVSEFMLQQTQVSRVIPKYIEWMRLFPSLHSLSQSPLSEVLTAWRGLGYNSRALRLCEVSKVLSNKHVFNEFMVRKEFANLPGIGNYTQSALCVFVFNEPHCMIETNIRTVYIDYYFQDVDSVSDAMIIPHIENTLDQSNPREWFWALMDYGAYIKNTKGNISRKNSSHKTQSTFSGSKRQLRAKLLFSIVESPKKLETLHNLFTSHEYSIEDILNEMVKEKLLCCDDKTYGILNT